MSTKIEWTDETWNPVRGCSIVSKGCTNCYAMRFAHRFSGEGQRYEGLTKASKGGPVWTGKVRLVPELLGLPHRWRTPRRVFVNSMSDLFHEDVPDNFIARVWRIMADTQQHTYQILTKRPERMLEWVSRHGQNAVFFGEEAEYQATMRAPGWPLRNVWLGVSVEDQASAEERIPQLLRTPAAVRWVSAEPLLGPVRVDDIGDGKGGVLKPLCGLYWQWSGTALKHHGPKGPQIDWVVAGGESGPGARPMHPDWARSLRDQCAAAGVPYFFKQWGAWLPPGQEGAPPSESADQLINASSVNINVGKKAAGRELDGRTHDEYPA